MLSVDEAREKLREAELFRIVARAMVRDANQSYRMALKTVTAAQEALREAKRWNKEPKPSSEAKDRGDKYYTGTKPCKHCGLIGLRFTSTRKCCACNAKLKRMDYAKNKLRRKRVYIDGL